MAGAQKCRVDLPPVSEPTLDIATRVARAAGIQCTAPAELVTLEEGLIQIVGKKYIDDAMVVVRELFENPPAAACVHVITPNTLEESLSMQERPCTQGDACCGRTEFAHLSLDPATPHVFPAAPGNTGNCIVCQLRVDAVFSMVQPPQFVFLGWDIPQDAWGPTKIISTLAKVITRTDRGYRVLKRPAGE